MTLAARSGSYIEFALPINCSEIKVLTKSTVASTASITFTADGNSIEATFAVGEAEKEYSLMIPAEYRAAGTVYRIARKMGTPIFDKFTYVEAVEGGSSLTAAVTDLAFATALNGTQTKTVKGNAEGLTEDITVTVDNEAFSAPATLTAEALAAGFDVTFTGSATDSQTGTLTLKSGDLTATVALTGYAVGHAGTEADPLTPADVIALNNLNFGPFYVTGTISDKCADRGSDGIAETTELTENNIILIGADGKKIGVNLQLQEVIDVLNIVSNPDNAGQTVVIKGNLIDYMGTPGVTNTEYISGLTKALTVPYDITFDEAAKVEGWTAVSTDPSDRAKFVYTEGNFAWPVYSALPGMASKNLFSSNQIEKKDSWLITPAFKLKAGKKYIVKYTVGITADVLANIGIFYGTDATAEAMTNEALAKHQELGKGLAEDQFYSISATIAPASDGIYYIGFLDDTDKYNSAKTVISAVSVTEAASGQMPGEPTDFTAVPAADGALSVDLSAKAPTVDAEGNALTELTALEFLNGSTVVKTFDNPTPGQVYTHTDKTNVKHGSNTYGVRAVNSFGNSNVVEASFKAGLETPKELTDVTAIQTETGRVKFSWTKPEYSFNGTLFTNPDLITVKIVAYDGATEFKTFDGLTGDEAVVDILPATTTDQRFFNFKAFAVTSGGPSINGVDVNGVAVGKPSELPYSENFSGNEVHNPMYISTNEGQYGYRASWEYKNSIDDVPVASLNAGGYSAQSSLISGLIELPAGSENQMTFKYSNNGSMSAANLLTVKINGKEVWSKSVSNQEFETAEIDLAEFAGQTIQFALVGKMTSYYYPNLIVTDILIDKKSGIADIEADENAPVEYFNLQGIRVENPAAGIYIRRQGSKVTKVLVK